MSAKKQLPKLEELSKDTQPFFDVLNDEPEFIQIVVGAAYLDACLRAMLERYLAESRVTEKLLDPRGGALGTFAARADLCYCLGLISKSLYQDLKKIAEIRNIPAHYHLPLDFSHPEVKRLCGELRYIQSLSDATGGRFSLEAIKPRFVLTAVMISQRLLVDGLGLEHRTMRT